MNEITEFTLTEEQKYIVEMHLKALLKVCQQYQIPMFAAIAVENGNDGTKYNNIIYGAMAHNLYLADDHIERHALVANGFRVVPPRDEITFDMSDLL